MEKRVLLAVVLSFIVLYGYQALFPPPDPRLKPTSRLAPDGAPRRRRLRSAGPKRCRRQRPCANGAAPGVRRCASGTWSLRAAEVEAVFTTAAAVLKHWRLKRYLGADGRPLDLVPSALPTDSSAVLALGRRSGDRRSALPGAVQTERGQRGRLVTRTLVFEFGDASGFDGRARNSVSAPIDRSSSSSRRR